MTRRSQDSHLTAQDDLLRLLQPSRYLIGLHRGLKQLLVTSMLALTLGPAPTAMAEVLPSVPQEIPNIQPHEWLGLTQFNTASGQLLLTTQSGKSLQAKNIIHSPKNKEISFFLSNSAIQPSPKVITVQPDPIIKSIALEQRALEGFPAVKVTISLYTNAPYVPFFLTPQTQGLLVTIGKEMGPLAPTLATALTGGGAPAAMPANASAAPTMPSQPMQPTYQSYAAPQAAPQPIYGPASTAQVPTQPPAYSPKTLITRQPTAAYQRATAPYNAPVNTSNAALNAPKPMVANNPMPDSSWSYGQQQSASSMAPSAAMAAQVTIHDVFYDHNIISVISKGPMSIKHAFSLFDPDRYVVDFETAQLDPSLTNRAIPTNHPFIKSIRISQFDKNIVRLVVEFKDGHYPIELTQSSTKELVRLTL